MVGYLLKKYYFCCPFSKSVKNMLEPFDAIVMISAMRLIMRILHLKTILSTINLFLENVCPKKTKKTKKTTQSRE